MILLSVKFGWINREVWRRGDAQCVLNQALGRLLAGERDFLALAAGEAVAGVGLDGAGGILAGRGVDGGSGTEGDELGRWPRYQLSRLSVSWSRCQVED